MLELSHIYKTFNQGTIDEKVLFSDFNITVNDGDFVGVIGSNGSGKNGYVKTSFRAICRLTAEVFCLTVRSLIS